VIKSEDEIIKESIMKDVIKLLNEKADQEDLDLVNIEKGNKIDLENLLDITVNINTKFKSMLILLIESINK